ncbi:MAG TPA: helix-turn-helix transcriptional regulator [Candidatus Obscuribacterales bacterium]
MPRSSIQETEQLNRIATFQAAFAETVRALRHTKKYSQEEFAERSGLHRTYISDIERGVRNIAFSNIVRISEALDISLSKLMQMVERQAAEKH